MRSAWFVYTDDQGHEWALRLASAIGSHPQFGFRPLNGQRLPLLQNGRTPPRYTRVGAIRPRRVGLALAQADGSRRRALTGPYRSVPVGTQAAHAALRGVLMLPAANGAPVAWEVTSAFSESHTGSRLPWRER